MWSRLAPKALLAPTMISLADQVVVSASNFLTVVLIARALGPREFGVFSIAWLIVLFFASLQFALISSPMMSIAPKQSPDDEPAYFGAVFFQQAVFSVISLLLVWLCASAVAVLAPQLGIGDLALPIALAAFAYQSKDFLRRYFFVVGRLRSAVTIDLISYLGQIAVVGWLFTTENLGSRSALWAIIATSVISIVVFGPRVKSLGWRPAVFRQVFGRHWRFSRWLAADAALQFGSGYLYLFVAGGILGPAAVGALRAAQNLMGVIQVITLGLENIVPTKAGWHYHHYGVPGLLAYIGRVAVAGEVTTVLIGLVVAAAPEFWLGLVFGDSYVGHGGLVRLFAIIYAVVFVMTPIRAGLRAIEYTSPMLSSTAASSLVALASAYPLVRLFGVTGAALGGR